MHHKTTQPQMTEADNKTVLLVWLFSLQISGTTADKLIYISNPPLTNRNHKVSKAKLHGNDPHRPSWPLYHHQQFQCLQEKMMILNKEHFMVIIKLDTGIFFLMETI